MKTDDNLNYDIQLFHSLMKIINKRGVVALDINKNVKLKKVIFGDMVNFLLLKENNVCHNEVLKNMLNLMNNHSVKYSTAIDESYQDFILMVDRKTNTFKDKITVFLKENLNRGVTSNVKFLDKLDTYAGFGEENYMGKTDSHEFMVGEQLKIMLKDICVVFPEIVINEVNYEEKYIPPHWKLSKRHVGDVKKIIYDELMPLKRVYNNKELLILLEGIKTKTADLFILIENLPFYSKILSGDKTEDSESKPLLNKSVLDGIFYKTVVKYLFYCCLNLYIDLFEKISHEPILNKERYSKIEESEDKSVNDALLRGRVTDLRKSVAIMISASLNIFKKRKKLMNVSIETIGKSVMKSRVKEKFQITENLRKLSDEQRKIEDTMKNLKLGRWRMGQTRALFEYDKDQYDKERDAIEKTALIEMKVGRLDDVTLENREIFMMEHLEETVRENQLQAQEVEMDTREEGERDGEESW